MLSIGRLWEVIRIASRLPSKSYRDHPRLALRSLKSYKSHEQMEQNSLNIECNELQKANNLSLF
jgi:hypothetical protein